MYVSCFLRVLDALLTAEPFLTETAHFILGRVRRTWLHFWLAELIALQHSIAAVSTGFPRTVPSQRHADTVTFVRGCCSGLSML